MDKRCGTCTWHRHKYGNPKPVCIHHRSPKAAIATSPDECCDMWADGYAVSEPHEAAVVMLLEWLTMPETKIGIAPRLAIRALCGQWEREHGKQPPTEAKREGE